MILLSGFAEVILTTGAAPVVTIQNVFVVSNFLVSFIVTEHLNFPITVGS